MKLLVIRFSALGDVAMTVPVVYSLARRYPELDITVLSRPFVAPLFARMPQNVHFRGVDLKRYKGLGGLYRLFAQLKADGYEAVADLHGVLRTRVLDALFRLAGIRVARIDKGRRQRRMLLNPRRKKRFCLPTSFARYEAVFARLGRPVQTQFRSIYGDRRADTVLFAPITGRPDGRRWIGIAPFAAHAGKRLPDGTVQTLVGQLAAQPDQRIFLFGSKGEKAQLDRWADGLPSVQVVAGRLTLEGELALMSHLDVMVSMDSANMHLASLTGTPVVSVWGATHPCAGFMGWGQSEDNAIQLDLPCRPCSIFGNRPCRRGDYACLAGIRAESIAAKVEHIVKKQA